MSNPILYFFARFLPNWMIEKEERILRNSWLTWLDEIWIFLLLIFFLTYFLTSLGGQVTNLFRRLLEIIYFFINGYYRILYMMNQGFRTVNDSAEENNSKLTIMLQGFIYLSMICATVICYKFLNTVAIISTNNANVRIETIQKELLENGFARTNQIGAERGQPLTNYRIKELMKASGIKIY